MPEKFAWQFPLLSWCNRVPWGGRHSSDNSRHSQEQDTLAKSQPVSSVETAAGSQFKEKTLLSWLNYREVEWPMLDPGYRRNVAECPCERPMRGKQRLASPASRLQSYSRGEEANRINALCVLLFCHAEVWKNLKKKNQQGGIFTLKIKQTTTILRPKINK